MRIDTRRFLIVASKNTLSAFKPLDDLEGVYVATKGGLRCSAFKLNDKSVCLFSPVSGLGDEALLSLVAIGNVSHLIAPNHYHNAGLKEYAKQFPNAKLLASSEAAPRLAKLTGLNFLDLQTLNPLLPKSFNFLQPEGLKTGEVWVRKTSNLRRAWFVVDAISGPKATAKRDKFDNPEMLKTFPTYGVRDITTYSKWFLKQVEADTPCLVIPCHGGISIANDLPKRLIALHHEYFSNA
jgi:hypothetical protein